MAPPPPPPPQRPEPELTAADWKTREVAAEALEPPELADWQLRTPPIGSSKWQRAPWKEAPCDCIGLHRSWGSLGCIEAKNLRVIHL